MTDKQKAFLIYASRRYIWWGTANGFDAHTQKILAQVMNIGSWSDMCKLVELFPPEELLDVMNKSEIGQFNGRSWHFWHNRLSDGVPPMPQRVLS